MSGDIAELRERLGLDGPIYASVRGPESTAMLELSEYGLLKLRMENNDVGGGQSVQVSDAFALAWAVQFGAQS